MFEKILYVFGFLIFTLLLQWILYKIRKNIIVEIQPYG